MKIQEEKCRKIKSKFSLKWKKSLNARKQAYYNYLRNTEKAALYQSWYEESQDFLPFHLRPKIRRNERQDIVDTKVSEAKVKYNNSITTMKTSADNLKAKYISIDEEMINVIKAKTPGDEDCCSLLRSWWEQDVKNAENMSQEIWEHKKDYLIKRKSKSEFDGENTLIKLEDPLLSQEQSQQPRSQTDYQNKKTRKNSTRNDFRITQHNTKKPVNRQNRQQNPTLIENSGGNSTPRGNNNRKTYRTEDYNEPRESRHTIDIRQNRSPPALNPATVPVSFPPAIHQYPTPVPPHHTNPFLMQAFHQLYNPPGPVPLPWNRMSLQ